MAVPYLLALPIRTKTKKFKEIDLSTSRCCFMAPVLLSKAELAYLKDNSQFPAEYASTIKYRLNKKLRQFATEELPTLLQSGYLLTEFRHASSGFLTENRQKDNGNGPRRASVPRHPLPPKGDLRFRRPPRFLTTLRAQTC